ncbi:MULTISPECIES: toxin [Pseudomonas]|uniref:Toxin n=1 Tax=Pseudomonas fluorescens LMG 5329 TaxID=1324332 RepID=A0A0A1Z0N3_PSEFL|nr:toxin [Pseudomonas fluorescens]KGE66272.1 toxin [Pseudomonas fluorescens LMG 5329]NWE04462.1 toxin [Pseudomonas sp. IPO3749]NWF24579.1 toxin [Pseudomonas sp. IPO3749]
MQQELADILRTDEYRAFQQMLLNDPEAGVVIAHTGGLRKIRLGDPKRNKGKRGGIRVIYYYWHTGTQFWLFTVYDKDELDDLSNDQRKALKAALEREVKARTTP